MPSPPKGLRQGQRRFAVAAVFVVAIGGLYLIAAAVNHLAPFASSSSSPTGRGSAGLAPTASAPPGPGTTAAGPGSASLEQLMPDQGCDPSPSGVVQGFVGLAKALQCTNDPNLPSVVVDGFQFDSPAHYVAGLELLDRNIGFSPSGAGPSCPPSGSGSGSTPWQSSDFPSQSGQVLQCLRVNGQAAYIWTVPSRLSFIEAVDTSGQNQFAGLQNWFANDAQP